MGRWNPLLDQAAEYIPSRDPRKATKITRIKLKNRVKKPTAKNKLDTIQVYGRIPKIHFS
jgi:hypothetical protein